MTDQGSASSAFMRMGTFFSSNEEPLTANPICNIHLQSGKLQTMIGRGKDGDRIGFFLPMSMGGGFVGVTYETRYNTLNAKSVETAEEAVAWLHTQVRHPTFDRSHIDFEVDVEDHTTYALTEIADLDRLRTWCWKQMRAFVALHKLDFSDGWIVFSALPPVD
jgi:hypothetical protein